jgi:2-hydroxychromene-2-carboxylate isomerase
MAAGDLQSNGAAFRQTILNTNPGRLSPPNLYRLAQENGLDPDRLLADMGNPEVFEKLRRVRQAAETLGIWGTPGFTIGRTFVLGDVPETVLDQLIEAEAATASC